MSDVRSHIAVRKDMNGNRLPHPRDDTSTVLKAYEASRDEMIKMEKAQRFDAEKMSSLSQVEKKANEYVDKLKLIEEAEIYNKEGDSEAIKGMEWEGAKIRGVKKGKLYEIVRQVRKEWSLPLLQCPDSPPI